MLRLAAAFVLLGLLAGCGEGEDRRYPVQIHALMHAEGEEGEVRAALEQALAASPTFSPGGHRFGALQAEATLMREDSRTPGPTGRWVLRVEVEVPPDLRPMFAVATITAAGSTIADVTPPTAEVLADMAARAVEGLVHQCRLARGDEEAFAALLASGETEQILVALRYARDRQASRLAAKLTPLLEHEEPQVRIATLDVLGAVGSPDHAPAIVRAIHFLDPQATREAYRALARLGGPDAVGFLRFAAANEDDAVLREEAERALSSALSGRGASAAEGSRGVDLPKVARGHRQ